MQLLAGIVIDEERAPDVSRSAGRAASRSDWCRAVDLQDLGAVERLTCEEKDLRQGDIVESVSRKDLPPESRTRCVPSSLYGFWDRRRVPLTRYTPSSPPGRPPAGASFFSTQCGGSLLFDDARGGGEAPDGGTHGASPVPWGNQ